MPSTRKRRREEIVKKVVTMAKRMRTEPAFPDSDRSEMVLCESSTTASHGRAAMSAVNPVRRSAYVRYTNDSGVADALSELTVKKLTDHLRWKFVGSSGSMCRFTAPQMALAYALLDPEERSVNLRAEMSVQSQFDEVVVRVKDEGGSAGGTSLRFLRMPLGNGRENVVINAVLGAMRWTNSKRLLDRFEKTRMARTRRQWSVCEEHECLCARAALVVVRHGELSEWREAFARERAAFGEEGVDVFEDFLNLRARGRFPCDGLVREHPMNKESRAGVYVISERVYLENEVYLTSDNDLDAWMLTVMTFYRPQGAPPRCAQVWVTTSDEQDVCDSVSNSWKLSDTPLLLNMDKGCEESVRSLKWAHGRECGETSEESDEPELARSCWPYPQPTPSEFVRSRLLHNLSWLRMQRFDPRMESWLLQEHKKHHGFRIITKHVACSKSRYPLTFDHASAKGSSAGREFREDIEAEVLLLDLSTERGWREDKRELLVRDICWSVCRPHLPYGVWDKVMENTFDMPRDTALYDRLRFMQAYVRSDSSDIIDEDRAKVVLDDCKITKTELEISSKRLKSCGASETDSIPDQFPLRVGRKGMLRRFAVRWAPSILASEMMVGQDTLLKVLHDAKTELQKHISTAPKIGKIISVDSASYVRFLQEVVQKRLEEIEVCVERVSRVVATSQSDDGCSESPTRISPRAGLTRSPLFSKDRDSSGAQQKTSSDAYGGFVRSQNDVTLVCIICACVFSFRDCLRVGWFEGERVLMEECEDLSDVNVHQGVKRLVCPGCGSACEVEKSTKVMCDLLKKMHVDSVATNPKANVDADDSPPFFALEKTLEKHVGNEVSQINGRLLRGRVLVVYGHAEEERVVREAIARTKSTSACDISQLHTPPKARTNAPTLNDGDVVVCYRVSDDVMRFWATRFQMLPSKSRKEITVKRVGVY
ncbi:hypothetical protein CYMTET_39613 [Cymbomonas tetramitiformis]|uniref:Uncharacterized protein n=2 Tax=Cymbomonas tetramitiformis TaxID=36881 RepID=A0AAE0CAU7_9CHLO|nr:hypothetical protein CYMTET_39613 [Cymbomonas tetramitiformis]